VKSRKKLKYTTKEELESTFYRKQVAINNRILEYHILYTEWPPKNVYTLICILHVKVYTFFEDTLYVFLCVRASVKHVGDVRNNTTLSNL
jgi:hypothetical protein